MATCNSAGDGGYSVKRYDNSDCSAVSGKAPIASGSGTYPAQCLKLATDVYTKVTCPRATAVADRVVTVQLASTVDACSSKQFTTEQSRIQQGVCTKRQ